MGNDYNFKKSCKIACIIQLRISDDSIGQAIKSARGMPWHQEPKKDVTSCEKLRLGANIHRPADIRMGKPGTAIPYHCMVNT